MSFNYLLRNCTSGHRTNVRKNSAPQNCNFTARGGKSLVWTFVGSGEVNMAASTVVQCALNDTLDVHLYYIANGDIYGNANVHNQLTIKYLG